MLLFSVQTLERVYSHGCSLWEVVNMQDNQLLTGKEVSSINVQDISSIMDRDSGTCAVWVLPAQGVVNVGGFNSFANVPTWSLTICFYQPQTCMANISGNSTGKGRNRSRNSPGKWQHSTLDIRLSCRPNPSWAPELAPEGPLNFCSIHLDLIFPFNLLTSHVSRLCLWQIHFLYFVHFCFGPSQSFFRDLCLCIYQALWVNFAALNVTPDSS